MSQIAPLDDGFRDVVHTGFRKRMCAQTQLRQRSSDQAKWVLEGVKKCSGGMPTLTFPIKGLGKMFRFA